MRTTEMSNRHDTAKEACLPTLEGDGLDRSVRALLRRVAQLEGESDRRRWRLAEQAMQLERLEGLLR